MHRILLIMTCLMLRIETKYRVKCYNSYTQRYNNFNVNMLTEYIKASLSMFISRKDKPIIKLSKYYRKNDFSSHNL